MRKNRLTGYFWMHDTEKWRALKFIALKKCCILPKDFLWAPLLVHTEITHSLVFHVFFSVQRQEKIEMFGTEFGCHNSNLTWNKSVLCPIYNWYYCDLYLHKLSGEWPWVFDHLIMRSGWSVCILTTVPSADTDRILMPDENGIIMC